MSEAQYYIGIENPKDLRRNLLESAKMSVDILKAQYALREMREERKQVLLELQDSIQRLGDYLEAMRNILPEHKLEDLPDSVKRIVEQRAKAAEKLQKEQMAKVKRSAPKAKPAKKVEEKPPEPPKQEGDILDLSALEDKLNSIQDKLNKL